MNFSKADWGLLLIRLTVGGTFLYAGIVKLLALGMTVGYFASIGIHPVLTYLVVAGEILGGIIFLLGIYVRFSGVLFAAIMLGAIYYVTWAQGSATFQYTLVLLFVSLGMALIGPGAIALKKKTA